MAPHFSILAWRIPWTEEPGGATIHGVRESDTTERLNSSRGDMVTKVGREGDVR